MLREETKLPTLPHSPSVLSLHIYSRIVTYMIMYNNNKELGVTFGCDRGVTGFREVTA
jgi:hypothetical protein